MKYEPPPHSYDAPGLTPYEFLLRVMRDKSAHLSTRINAAAKLLPMTAPAPFYEPTAPTVLYQLPPSVFLQ